MTARHTSQWGYEWSSNSSFSLFPRPCLVASWVPPWAFFLNELWGQTEHDRPGWHLPSRPPFHEYHICIIRRANNILFIRNNQYAIGTVPYTAILTVWVQLIQLPVQAPNHATSEEAAAYTTSWHTQTKGKTCQAWSGELCVVLAVGSRRDASVFAARPQRVQRESVHSPRSHSVYILSRCKFDHRLLVNTPFWTHDEGKTWQLGIGTAWHNHQIWGLRTAQPRRYSHVLKTY